MTYHVLTGDALLSNFPDGKLEGAVIINRECLIEGPLKSLSLDDFWENRNTYLSMTYPESEINYEDDVLFEFEKLQSLEDGDEVNLWFEHDLFCQVNLWFTINLLPKKDLAVYRVFPVVKNPKDLWHGFGPMSSAGLMNCYNGKELLSPADIKLGQHLWKAYASNDMKTLAELSQAKSMAYPYLQEVCEAQIQRIPHGNQIGRPERVLKEIIDGGDKTFEKAFYKFSEREGIYGFGDLQVQRIYDQLIP